MRLSMRQPGWSRIEHEGGQAVAGIVGGAGDEDECRASPRR